MDPGENKAKASSVLDAFLQMLKDVTCSIDLLMEDLGVLPCPRPMQGSWHLSFPVRGGTVNVASLHEMAFGGHVMQHSISARLLVECLGPAHQVTLEWLILRCVACAAKSAVGLEATVMVLKSIGAQVDMAVKQIVDRGGGASVNVEVEVDLLDIEIDYKLDRHFKHYSDTSCEVLVGGKFYSVTCDKGRVGSQGLQNGFLSENDNNGFWAPCQVVVGMVFVVVGFGVWWAHVSELKIHLERVSHSSNPGKGIPQTPTPETLYNLNGNASFVPHFGLELGWDTLWGVTLLLCYISLLAQRVNECTM